MGLRAILETSIFPLRLHYENQKLTYKNTLLDRLFGAVDLPFAAELIIWFLRTITITEQLQIKQINKIDLDTCNHSLNTVHSCSRLGLNAQMQAKHI